MQVSCPRCTSKFNLPDQLAMPGAKLRCTVCKNVFQLPGGEPPPSYEQPYPPGYEQQAPGYGMPPPDVPPAMPPMPAKPAGSRGGLKWLWISLVLLVLLGGGGAYYYFFMMQDKAPPATAAEVEKKVELLTMRNVRQYNVPNEKVGKVFVIEGRVVNEFPEPKELVELEGAIYDKDKKPIAVKRQLAGTQLSLFQLQVLSEQEMESFLNNKVEILSNNTNIPPGGEVPFMILFYGPPDNVAEFGVKIVDVQDPAKK